MRDTDLFNLALGLKEPWYVKEIEFKEHEKRIDIFLDFKKGGKFSCSKCEAQYSAYDSVEKQWRHLNFFEHETYLHARTPRTNCSEHGVLQVAVPWTANNSGFTILFEAFIMAMVKAMPVAVVARMIKESDQKLWRVIKHYVNKAVKEMDLKDVRKIGIDETAAKRGHNYISLVVDLNKRNVIFVDKGKDSGVLNNFKRHLEAHNGKAGNITDVSCDMSPAFIKGVEENFKKAKITFDKFHIMKIINAGLDEVRRQEQMENPNLKNTRYYWLKNPENLDQNGITFFKNIETENWKTIHAYQLKLAFRNIFMQSKENAIKSIIEWYYWVLESSLEPMIEAAKTIWRHINGVLRWLDSQISNGVLEGLNSVIQTAKSRARGYRNIEYFKLIVYLIAGKLKFDLPT
jgi:transposase